MMGKALCLLAGVFALTSMANAQGLCSSIDDSDCGSGFVTTGRDSFVCANDPCDVDTPGADDHPDCCMAEIVPLDCSDIEQGKPLQVLGYEDPDLQLTNISKLNILTGSYDLLFDLDVTRTTPNHEQLNACAVNPLDQNLYCLVRFADDSSFMVRFDATSVHYVAELNLSMGFPVSAIIDEEGDFFAYQFETGNYYMIPTVQNMAGKADQANTPFLDHTDMFFTSTNNVELKIFDIVIVNGNFDNEGEARWLFGLTSTRDENVVSSIYFNKGVATKATAGVNFGQTFILNHSFTDESIAPTSGGWGAGWMYYDNILFASNHGSGVFLCEIDIPNGLVYMSRVGLSDATSLNDGMNCGPPALLPFASCQGRTGPGTTATVDADCGAGWVADLSSDLVCDFDPNLGLGCNTGTSSSPDQRKCCNLDCSTYSCNGHGTPFADDFDTGCFCDCDLGYTGDQCDECAPAYTGYPNCVPTLAPSLSPTSSSPTAAPSDSPSSTPTGAPTVSPDLSIDSDTKREGNTATLTVTLSRVHDQDVTVDWTTLDGTAVSPGDYPADSGQVTILAGQTTATIDLDTNLDGFHTEADEVFYVVLSNSVNAHISGPPGSVTIRNLPAISVGNQTVTEGDIATVTLTRSMAVSWVSTVEWITSDDTAAVANGDYTTTTGLATFNGGDLTTTIDIQTLIDTEVEASEVFEVILSNPSSAVIDVGTGYVTIIDGPRIRISDAVVPEGGIAQVFITLNKASDHAITVDWNTQDLVAVDANDYDFTSGQVTFAPGQTSIPITIQTNLDSIEESDETFNVVLSNPIGAGISNSQGTGTVTIYDVPDISVGDAVVVEGNGVNVVVTLSHPSTQPITVNWENAPNSATIVGGDFDPDTGIITFPPGTTEVSIFVATNTDAVDEGDEIFDVVLSGASNGNIVDNTGQVTILDAPEVSISDASVQECGAASVTISLSHPSTTYTSVDWNTAHGTASNNDYVSNSGTITFAPGQTSIDVPVQSNCDGNLEGSETVLVQLSNPSNVSISNPQGTVTIFDIPSISVGDGAGVEGDIASVDICLSHTATQSISVTWSGSDNTASAGDYIATGGTITFAPGELCVTVDIPLSSDEIEEGSENFFIILSNPSSNSYIEDGTGSVTIEEDQQRVEIQATTTSSYSKSGSSSKSGSKGKSKKPKSMGMGMGMGKSMGAMGKSGGSKSGGSKSGYSESGSETGYAVQGAQSESGMESSGVIMLVAGVMFTVGAMGLFAMRTQQQRQTPAYELLRGFPQVSNSVNELTPLWDNSPARGKPLYSSDDDHMPSPACANLE